MRPQCLLSGPNHEIWAGEVMSFTTLCVKSACMMADRVPGVTITWRCRHGDWVWQRNRLQWGIFRLTPIIALRFRLSTACPPRVHPSLNTPRSISPRIKQVRDNFFGWFCQILFMHMFFFCLILFIYGLDLLFVILHLLCQTLIWD